VTGDGEVAHTAGCVCVEGEPGAESAANWADPAAGAGRLGCRGMELRMIGSVSSPLRDRETAPKQGDEGAPDATIAVAEEFAAGLEGIAEGDELRRRSTAPRCST